MEGKCDEVLAAKAKACQLKKDKAAALNCSTASGICHDKSGHVYIIDSQTNQVILLASDSTSPPTMAPELALAMSTLY